MTPNGRAPAALAETPSYSRFGQRIRRRYPTEMALLAPGLPDRSSIAALCDHLCAAGAELGAALRMIRQGAAALGRKPEDIRVAGRGCDLRIKLC